MHDLDKVVRQLKKNKTQDPSGLINELFKPGVIGIDLKKGTFVTVQWMQAEPNYSTVSSTCQHTHYLQK